MNTVPMIHAKLAALAILAPLAMSEPANAQSADVSLVASIAPSSFLAPGADAVVTLTLHNAGPDSAPLISMGTLYPATQGFRTFNLYPVAGTAPCIMHFDEFYSPMTGMGTVYVNIFSPRNIPPGGTVRCDFGLRVAAELRTRTVVSFVMGVSGARDPNPGNNDAAIVLQLQPAAVPALTMPGALTLTIALLLAAMHARTRRT